VSSPALCLGCHWLSSASRVDVDGRTRTWANVYGRPQTVLKTAELTSADVHQSPPRFNLCCRHSAVMRYRPQSSAGLAVFLAVKIRTAGRECHRPWRREGQALRGSHDLNEVDVLKLVDTRVQRAVDTLRRRAAVRQPTDRATRTAAAISSTVKVAAPWSVPTVPPPLAITFQEVGSSSDLLSGLPFDRF
jgi:hypothetical protein